MRAVHAREETIATHALVMTGCRCGWTHAEHKGFDAAAAARRRLTEAYKTHKAESKES